MDTIIFIPGILGSKLNWNGPPIEEIWPPGIEDILGYTKIQKLLDPNDTPSGLIDYVCSLIEYQPIDDYLTDICGQLNSRKVIFYYDWRVDINRTADELTERIDTESTSGGSIVLVCHSMGTLIGRLVLESGRYTNRPGFSKITKYISICGPHLG